MQRHAIPVICVLSVLAMFHAVSWAQESTFVIGPQYVRDDVEHSCKMMATGITLKAGDVIKFSATGTWSWDGVASCGPDGTGVKFADYPRHALVGRVGSQLFFIGTEYTLTVQSGGELFVGRNDNQCNPSAAYQGSLQLVMTETAVDTGGLSTNVRILVLLGAMVLFYILTRFLLYEFLIKKGTHPFKAKAVFISLFLLFSLSAFAALFYDLISVLVLVALGVIWLIYFIFVLLK
jgi:hypothetical protein